MSNLPSDDEIALLKMDINRINLTSTAIEASLGAEIPSTDILALATQAYQQGKITKTQFMGVVNALDEQSNQTIPIMAQFILLPEDKNNPVHVPEFINIDNILRIKIDYKNEVPVAIVVTFVDGKIAVYKGNHAKELIDVIMEQRLNKGTI